MMKKFRFDQFPGFVVLDFNDACSIASSLKQAAKANHELDNILKSHPVWFATYRKGTLHVYVLAHKDVCFPLQEGHQHLFKTILSAREVDVKCSTLNAEVYRFDGIRGLTKIEGTSDEIEEQLPAIFEAIHRHLPENCYVDRFPWCKSFQVRDNDNRVILVARHVDYNGIMAYLSKYQGQQVNQAILDKELAVGLELKLRGNDIDIVDVDVDVWNSSHD